MTDAIKPTDHGADRLRQRGIKEDQVAVCMRWGDMYHTVGTGHKHAPEDRGEVAYFLGDDAVARAAEVGVKIQCSGIAVVVAPNGRIVTVMRIRRPSKSWKRA